MAPIDLLERERGAMLGKQFLAVLGVLIVLAIVAGEATGTGLHPVGVVAAAIYLVVVAAVFALRIEGRRFVFVATFVVPLLLATNLIWGHDLSRILLFPHVIYVAWFASRWAPAIVGVAGIAFAIALVVNPHYEDLPNPVATWLVTVGSLGLAAVVVSRIRGRSDTQRKTVLTLARVLDLRDTGTATHSASVGEYTCAMATHLGLGPSHIARLTLAGIVHDIGKIAVSDATLRKPGPLDPAEWDEMQRHPDVGAEILAESGLDDIAAWVRMHHERLDGRGYPRSLTADEIPLEARILAVADAYEAMTADRPYRRAIGPEAAREQLDQGRGTQFDPEVVRALIEALPHLRGEDRDLAPASRAAREALPT